MSTAVEGLQACGLKVIVVSSRAEPALDLQHAAASVDRGRLLHVQALSDAAVEVLLCSDRYRCPFVTNRDVNALVCDWRLPPRAQLWLRRELPNLHIGWRVTEAGDFGACFPPAVRKRVGAAARAHGAGAAPDAGALCAAAAWLGGPEAQAEPAAPPWPAQQPWTCSGTDDDVPPMALLASECGARVLCLFCTQKSSGLFP
ncbi:unnamed protein product [Prorocentrum cordatum]|uniref:Uncharacterized protein n=1 Tax=Prorocentrum cordatum TaxID=2364126 RepID=A0ABN9QY46_9DINO|nr:unnamed protein product [Polarella glacialis]